MESILYQGSTHDKAYLPLSHAGAKLIYHVLRHDVALLYVDFIYPGDNAASAEGDRDSA